MLSRTPPTAVLETLRQEVGFRCPVAGCGRPYLSWHHFDPPWRIEQHHRPEGMIALCVDHAAKADGGAFTDEQLRELKRSGRSAAQAIEGEFDWLRREILAVIGGNFYYRKHDIIQIGDQKCVWFRRDEQGDLRLNFWMPTESGERRARVVDNLWTVPPDAADVVCPPRGRTLAVKYPNGDALEIEFITVVDAAALGARYPGRGTDGWADQVTFPVTVVEISQKAPGLNIELGPRRSRLGGATLENNFLNALNPEGAAVRIAALAKGLGGERFAMRGVRLPDLVDASRPIIQNARFVECDIEGPAVIAADGSDFIRCSFPRELDAFLWSLPSERVIGAVVVKDCVFERCRFHGVGLAGSPEFLAAMRSDLEKV